MGKTDPKSRKADPLFCFADLKLAKADLLLWKADLKFKKADPLSCFADPKLAKADLLFCKADPKLRIRRAGMPPDRRKSRAG